MPCDADRADRGQGQAPVAPNWYETAFGDLYPVLYAHRTVAAAAAEAGFAARCLCLTREDRLLDLACGAGRHLVHLRDMAGWVAGLDYAPNLLAEARRRHGLKALVRGDMRSIPFQRAFDVVTSFFTSFGYFPSYEENLRTVRGVARALRPDGRFFIDYMNRDHVMASLNPRTERKAGDYDVVEERWIVGAGERVNKRTTVTRERALVTRLEESVRLYTAAEFEALLREGGLVADALYGDHSGAVHGPDAERMVAVGRAHG